MQTQATQKTPQPSKPPPFFSVQAQREPAFFSQSQLGIAAQSETDSPEELPNNAPIESMMPERAIEEPVVQASMTMGAPGDRYEREADVMADQVVQRKFAGEAHGAGAPAVQAKCSACHEEEGTLRRQTADGAGSRPDEEMLQARSDGSMDVPGNVQKTLEAGAGGGSPMQTPVRDDMESAFQTDFSEVKIHTGSTANGLNEDLNAQAFTYGKDVYFSAGEYQPHTPAGQHLLAHELTHVVQQNPGLQKKSRPPASPSSQVSTVQGSTVQAHLWSFGPPSGKFFKGTKIHNDVLPMFAKANTDAFIEVTIPGANKEDVDTGRRGIADLYKAKPASGDSIPRTIGINWSEDGPTYLSHNTRMEGGGKDYKQNKHSAPRGGKHQPRVQGLKQGPGVISLGDLKPGNSVETILGASQLGSYTEGITNTSSSINAWLAQPENKDQSDAPKRAKKTWEPKLRPLGPSDLRIPKELDLTGSGKGIYPMPLAVYKDGFMSDKISGLKGAMYVYPAHVAGIWAYEWLPTTYPEYVDSDQVGETLNRLEKEVIGPVKSTGQASPMLRKSPRRRAKPTIRRKESGFPLAAWQKSYGKWKGDAEKSVATPNAKKDERLGDTLLDVEKRSAGRVKLPQKVKQRARGYSKIRHWIRFGGIYGWLRNTFDGAYTKVKALADKIKQKVKRLARRVGNSSFGSWVKAAIKVVFKIFKIVASWAITQVVDQLLGSLQQGITNNINKLIEAVTPEGVKSKIEEFEEKKAEYEKLIAAKQEELEKKLFGDKLDLMEKLEQWEYIADKVGTIATIVEWGVRIIACFSPPAIGCLWNLVISALQAAFAMLIQTCWFTKKVYLPVMNAIDEVKDFPKRVAAEVVEAANKHLPLPAGMEPLFAPITLNNSDIPLDCQDGGGGGAELTPEREAILELIEEIGEEKFRALLAVMLKHGAGPWVLLTPERVKEIKGLIEEVKIEQLQAAAEQPSSGVPVPLEKFLEGIAKYSKQEKNLIRQSNEQKKGEAEGGGGKGGDGGGKYAAPIAKQPAGKVDGNAKVYYAAGTQLPEPLKPGGNFPKELSVMLRILVVADKSKGDTTVYPVRVKVKVVTADRVEFINVETFYAFFHDKEWVQIPKDYVFHIPVANVTNSK